VAKFWFKHEYWGDDWEEVQLKCFSAERAAEIVAEDYRDSDPGDPNDFEFDVSIKDEKGKVTNFSVTASISVDFSAREKEEPAKEVVNG
jgi:hypothetical protein